MYSAWLFMAALGLTLIYGVMKIVNVTHGSFYALGAYAGASFTGAWLARGYPPMLSYAVLLAAAVVITLAMGGGLAWLQHRTRVGKLLLAVIHDPEVSRAMGINVGKYYLVTFTFGSMLAALAGSFSAPTVSVVPGLGIEVIVLSFAVVVIGGLGSLPGAARGAVIVGLVRSISVHYMPQVELFVIYFVMAMVLALRPRGLFSLAEPRKI